MPPRVLRSSFMLQRWLQDRQLSIEYLYKRAGVSKRSAYMFIYEFEENMRKGTMNVRFDDVLKLQKAANDIDKELFSYLYKTWV